MTGIVVILIVVFVLSLLWGRYPQVGFTRFSVLSSDALARSLIWNIRLPRAINAVMLGSALAAAGMILQTVLGNPLVEPGMLGVSQGAAFGAALAILLAGGRFWSVSLSATIFGLAGLALSWFLAGKIRYGGAILRLVLAGVVVSAFFSSGLGILKYLADPRSELPEITFWLMGGLTSSDWSSVGRTVPPVVFSLTLMILVRWRINLLSLDDRSAFSLGTNPGRERFVLVVLSVIAVAAVTAAAGIISWVGLLVPHVARKIEGADTARSLPLAIMLGAIFVLISDDFARGLLSGEIPLGLLTALGGAVLFALLMTRKDVSKK
ncbi:MAG: iron ABC transporter permease [Spirochaetaceae bacterium]|nr:iron ABC transporter permease [Spirochaetaceae bacterium]